MVPVRYDLGILQSHFEKQQKKYDDVLNNSDVRTVLYTARCTHPCVVAMCSGIQDNLIV